MGKERDILGNRFILGQYRPANSIGHRLDPRAKIIMVAFLMIISLFTTSVIFYSASILTVTIMLLLSDISVSVILRNSRPFILLVALTALYHLLFSARDSQTVAVIFGFRLTSGGLSMAASFSLRVLLFIGTAFFISLTTLPADLAESLVSALKPLRKIGVPANDIGLIVFIAMRFIPVLAEEAETIKKAQIVRGVDFSGGLAKRARNFVYLLLPVFQSAIRRADELAVAIESRGYISGAERSSFRIFQYGRIDWVFMSITTVLFVTLFIFTRTLP